jgi:hypothetical protein
LHVEVFIAVKTAPLCVTTTTSTVHLRLSRPRLTVILYLLPDTTEGFGLWLCPASAEHTGRAFVFYCLGLRGLPLGQPPFFAFSRAARVLAADFTRPPSLPNATAALFFIHYHYTQPLGYVNRFFLQKSFRGGNIFPPGATPVVPVGGSDKRCKSKSLPPDFFLRPSLGSLTRHAVALSS